MYETDEEDSILLGHILLNDSIISFRRGAKELIDDCPTEDGRHHLYRIQEMARELDKIEKKYRSSIADYEQQVHPWNYELREVSYEDAKKEIKQYFEAHHGENIDAADLQEALGIDIQVVSQICQDLARDEQVKETR